MANIIYQANNCSLTGPSSANSGQLVNVSVTPVSGASVNSSMISITRNGSNIPFSFDGSIISFFMPS